MEYYYSPVVAFDFVVVDCFFNHHDLLNATLAVGIWRSGGHCPDVNPVPKLFIVFRTLLAKPTIKRPRQFIRVMHASMVTEKEERKRAIGVCNALFACTLVAKIHA